MAAARRSGADAVHPGYGFLSQNGDFADAVAAAGLAFVGPPGPVHRRMGDKKGARRLMAKAGVPIVPGYDGDDQADATLAAEAARIGWPVMIKPSRAAAAGKGMRIVRAAGDFARSAGRRPPRGQRRLRRRRRGAGAVRRPPPPRRGPGARGRARRDRPSPGARVLDPAAAPEGGRGDAEPRPRRGGARDVVRGRGGGGARGGIRQRGDGRVPDGPRGRLLLPGDEHAAAGGAPGDGEHPRARPRPAPDRGRGGPAADHRAGRRRRPRPRAGVPAVRRGPVARPPPVARARPAPRRRPRAPASASTPASPPAPR